MDSSEKGVQLLALEVINNKHHWNEHIIWGLRLKDRGITRKNWKNYKEKKFEFRLNTLWSDIFFNFYFLINSVYLGTKRTSHKKQVTDLELSVAASD